jgi:hypothetical protein
MMWIGSILDHVIVRMMEFSCDSIELSGFDFKYLILVNISTLKTRHSLLRCNNFATFPWTYEKVQGGLPDDGGSKHL